MAKLYFHYSTMNAGKSTILRAIDSCDRCEVERERAQGVHYFNAEMMNPHNPANSAGDLHGMILRSRGVFASHGEIMKSALASIPLRKGETLLVDEPEAGQDMEGVRRIRRGLDSLCRKGGQAIVASHHPAMMVSAHLIELAPGYLGHVREAFLGLLSDGRPDS